MSTPSTRRARIDWTAAPMVFIKLPSCPNCRSLKYDSKRSVGNGDASRTKPVICRECGEPFLIISEPDFQDLESDEHECD